MIHTEGEIVTAIWRYVCGTALADAITGEVYKDIDRPVNSELEDIVVRPLTNVPRQKQTCVINVNVYVPDHFDDGQYVKDGERCDLLEKESAQLLEVFFIEGARIYLDTQHTYEVKDAKAHVINNRLVYTVINER
jgi:hypothetical protein